VVLQRVAARFRAISKSLQGFVIKDFAGGQVLYIAGRRRLQ